ncbi:MAG: alcohol dehydrogenase catalytic domain-containing protein [Armatimonadetes bacterium]|nr:alcohol dehydrogenase catalytic domain-containing protein [Armatimonadota bacterium]
MRALLFHPTVPRYALTRALGAVRPSAYLGRTSPLQYRDVPDPPLPGDDWVRVAVRLGGICGSDLHLVRLEASPATSAYTSFPFVPGHENVGTIIETGRAVEGLAIGQRVTVEPVLPCITRGIAPPCPNCAAGDYNRCLRVTEGHLSAGLMIGACRDTGGSWGEFFVAHRSQVLPVPDDVSDEGALLAEPMACALHPLLRNPPPDGATVLIIGGGVIGQCAVASLRAMGSRARVLALVKYRFQEAMARRLGADITIRLGPGDAHYETVAEITGGTLRRPILGKRVLIGGADLTIECVGSSRSLDDALRLTRPGGRVLLLGLAAIPRGVDWTPIWLNELHVTGSYVYALEGWQGGRRRTMEIVLDWMAGGTLDVAHLVTQRFPLSAYRQAIETATRKAKSAAFKVALHPSEVLRGPSSP